MRAEVARADGQRARPKLDGGQEREERDAQMPAALRPPDGDDDHDDVGLSQQGDLPLQIGILVRQTL